MQPVPSSDDGAIVISRLEPESDRRDTREEHRAHLFAWGDDPEFAATLHLLDTPLIAARTARYVDVDRRAIDWTALLDAAAKWSYGEHLLVDAALDMWNGDAKTPLGELYLTLDDGNLQRVMEALAIRRRMAMPYEAGLR